MTSVSSETVHQMSHPLPGSQETDGSEKAAAALKIQSIYRGHITRTRNLHQACVQECAQLIAKPINVWQGYTEDFASFYGESETKTSGFKKETGLFQQMRDMNLLFKVKEKLGLTSDTKISIDVTKGVLYLQNTDQTTKKKFFNLKKEEGVEAILHFSRTHKDAKEIKTELEEILNEYRKSSHVTLNSQQISCHFDSSGCNSLKSLFQLNGNKILLGDFSKQYKDLQKFLKKDNETEDDNVTEVDTDQLYKEITKAHMAKKKLITSLGTLLDSECCKEKSAEIEKIKTSLENLDMTLLEFFILDKANEPLSDDSKIISDISVEEFQEIKKIKEGFKNKSQKIKENQTTFAEKVKDFFKKRMESTPSVSESQIEKGLDTIMLSSFPFASELIAQNIGQKSDYYDGALACVYCSAMNKDLPDFTFFQTDLGIKIREECERIRGELFNPEFSN